MNIQSLLDAGYTQFDNAVQAFDRYYRSSFQKRVTDERGIRYFITLDHGILPANPAIVGEKPRAYFTPKDQFSRSGITFNIELIPYTETIADIEGFYHDLWTALRCDYYEVNSNRRVEQGA